MSASRILDAPGQREQLWPLSVAAYHALGDMGLIPEKTELLHGFVFHKMPKSPQHSTIVARLLEHLQRAIGQQKLCARMEQPLSHSNSEPEPDLAVAKGKRDDFFNSHPSTAELVVEVAVTSHEADLAKASIYAAAGVKEYWLVDVPGQSIEIRRHPEKDSYIETELITVNGVARSQVMEGFEVQVRELLKQ